MLKFVTDSILMNFFFFFQSHYKTISKALQLKLSGRGSIDSKEEEIIPVWLRNTELSRSQKWHLSVHFKLTYEASLLSGLLEQLKLSSTIFGSKIGRVYDNWGKDYHGRKLELPKTEAEWIELFTELGIHDRLEKNSIKALFSYDDGKKGGLISTIIPMCTSKYK